MWVRSLTAGRLATRWHCPTIDKYFTSLPLPAFTQGKRTVFSSQYSKPSLTNLSEGSSWRQTLAHRPWTVLQQECLLYITQGPKSLDTRWFKHRFISYRESLNWLLSILEFLFFNKYQLKDTSKHIFPPWASVSLSLNKSNHNAAFAKCSELHWCQETHQSWKS